MMKTLMVVLCCLGSLGSLAAQQIAFPGAEGFGAYAQGGRGGDVYTVNNLTDFGAGSLRYGIQTATGPRTIVFAVSGIIKLRGDLNIDKDYITIAGQTAPGDGICLRDGTLVIKGNHIIVRYIRSRLGDEAGLEHDAVSIVRGHNVIMDHCSASWSVDEVFSCSTADQGEIDSVTVQWSIISEALENSIHTKGAHSYGALIRGCFGAKYSYHHNLFAHNRSRNPRPGNYDENNRTLDPEGLLLDFRNNVMYNWAGSKPGYDGDEESVCRYNYVGNYGKPGPDSNPTGYAYSAGCKHFRGYYADNHFFGEIPEDPWSLVTFSGSWTSQEKIDYKQSSPFPTGPVTTDSPQDAYDKVLERAGASIRRDTVDARVVNDVIQGTGSIIDDEDEVGSWPTYLTYNERPDLDQDGMADHWETIMGLDPQNPDDRNGDQDGDGFTNLEEYLDAVITLDPLSTEAPSFAGKQLFSCYPNPTEGPLHIKSLGEGLCHISILDMSGHEVFSATERGNSFEVDLGKQAPGLYLVVLQKANGSRSSQKIILK